MQHIHIHTYICVCVCSFSINSHGHRHIHVYVVQRKCMRTQCRNYFIIDICKAQNGPPQAEVEKWYRRPWRPTTMNSTTKASVAKMMMVVVVVVEAMVATIATTTMAKATEYRTAHNAKTVYSFQRKVWLNWLATAYDHVTIDLGLLLPSFTYFLPRRGFPFFF